MTYKELSEKFIDDAGVSIGDTVFIEKDDVSYEGIILDRSNDALDEFIVIKLDSGYNIGINIKDA
ncbi:MAG: Glu-tRNA(Gln) amidotransferase GatDE subunit D, partial [Methanobacteriaceae archaeon]|nr:Glu-tRNA(Gln) amidotransferase GatDE subunit D [Methanobacteriaceae archaeon]